MGGTLPTPLEWMLVVAQFAESFMNKLLSHPQSSMVPTQPHMPSGQFTQKHLFSCLKVCKNHV